MTDSSHRDQHSPSAMTYNMARLGAGLFTVEPTRYTLVPGVPTSLPLPSSAIGRTVRPGDELAYALFPESPAGLAAGVDDAPFERLFDATSAVVDLRFADGRALSTSAVRDTHGILITPSAAYDSKRSPVDQWTLVRVDLSSFSGAEIAAINLIGRHPGPEGSNEVHGFVEVVALGNRAEAPGSWAHLPQEDAVDSAITTRGTHSTAQLSRGLTLPASAMPFGFQLLNPVTDASTWAQAYTWNSALDDRARPSLQALAISHIPSPWIGDRGVIHVFPMGADGAASRTERARTFRRRSETASPYRYAVTFDDGLVIDAATAQRAAMLEVRFDDVSVAAGPGLVFDQIDDCGALDLSRATEGTIRITSRGAGESVAGAPPVHAIVKLRPAPVSAAGVATDGRASVHGLVRFAPGTRAITMRIATSFIDTAQARRNLAELAPEDTVRSVAARARDAWSDLLSLVTIHGASEEHLVTLASNLYRMFLYPSITHELGPDGRARHAAMSSEGELEIRSGERSSNNGFWDTYRTVWPALQLLQVEQAGRLIDGFVEHFTSDGWIPRWSAPGPVDCMVGTSSDNVIADALAAGVPLADPISAYDSMLRNATSFPSSAAVGRKGLSRGIFRGYIDRETPEGLSWSLENAISDSAISRTADLLAETYGRDHPRFASWRAEAQYFRRRAANHAHVFDPSTGFYRGRNSDGAFEPSSDFDSSEWGGDYTETNAWGMRFTAPHDGVGLAHLHGGNAALGGHLDEFFATPERATPDRSGSYGFVIHEMTEARNVRMGMFGPSNQPAHHIPFMYAFSDRPHAMDPIVRECVRRLFLGWEIGQGYPGDEDNGEMSAWWFWLAAGLYPLSPGSGEYVICAPSFDRMSITLPGGREWVVHTRENAAGNDYIQAVYVNGATWNSRVIPTEVVRRGGIIEVSLGPEPTGWETGGPLPASVTPAGHPPRPWLDVAISATLDGIDMPGLVDDVGDDTVALLPGAEIEIALSRQVDEAIVTLSVGSAADRGPSEWQVYTIRADKKDEIVAEFHAETFRWAGQTRPFLASLRGADRIALRFPRGGVLRQVELCAIDPLPGRSTAEAE